MQDYTLRGVHRKTSSLKKFLVVVIIENKMYLRDPEGDTILRDLVVKGGYPSIESVRSAKTLKIIVRSSSEKKACKIVENLCTELRIYNPVLSECTIESRGRIREQTQARRTSSSRSLANLNEVLPLRSSRFCHFHRRRQ